MTGLRILACAVAFATCALPIAGHAEGGINLVTVSDVFAGLKTAQTVTIAAYSLAPNARITRAIIAAADRGARVTVALSSSAFGANAQQNEETTALLTEHHVSVHGSPTRSHIKIASLDGHLYLSDRNFASSTSQAIVVSDTVPGDRMLIEKSILGQPGSNAHLWTRKGDALSAEAGLIRVRSSRSLIVSTESFNANTAVFTAMLARRQMNDSVRLLVAANEYRTSRTDQEAVSRLRAAGAEVRISRADEKFAVDGDNVFFGSANQTGGYPDQIDFGIAVTDRSLATRLRAQFETEWAEASTPENAQ